MNYVDEASLAAVTDEVMNGALATTRPYTICILRPGPRYQRPGPEREWVTDVIWEHAKRNYALLISGLKRVVCPVADGSDVVGVSIYDANQDDVKRIMQEDPGVKAGLLAFEIHPTFSFPESSLSSAHQ